MKRYTYQINASLTMARGRLEQAQNIGVTVNLPVRALARALEFAVAAVFVAWGYPKKASPKIHDAFQEKLAPMIDQDCARGIQFIWDSENIGQNETDFKQLIDICKMLISYLAKLTEGMPPPGWIVPEMPAPLLWDELDIETRDFASQALTYGRISAPTAEIILFGSRASGHARPNSDYDLLFVCPNDIADSDYHQALGRVSSFATESGVDVDLNEIREENWLDPDEPNELLVDIVRLTGVKVPSQGKDLPTGPN